MNDEMNHYAGIASVYSELPLSSLHELHSIINWEISKRLEAFGVYPDEVSVGDVAEKQTGFSEQNLQEKNVIHVKFGRGNE